MTFSRHTANCCALNTYSSTHLTRHNKNLTRSSRFDLSVNTDLLCFHLEESRQERVSNSFQTRHARLVTSSKQVLSPWTSHLLREGGARWLDNISAPAQRCQPTSLIFSQFQNCCLRFHFLIALSCELRAPATRFFAVCSDCKK